MEARIYESLAVLLAAKEDIDIETAEEIVDEVVYKIRDFMDGESEYNSVAEIISDFLDLGSSYSELFI